MGSSLVVVAASRTYSRLLKDLWKALRTVFGTYLRHLRIYLERSRTYFITCEMELSHLSHLKVYLST